MRQFIAPGNPDARGILRLVGKDYRYFKQVLRVKVGDMAAVRLIDGTLQNMTVCRIDEASRFLELQICADGGTITRGTQASALESSNIEYYLFQFVARPQKMDIIIRQATECGVLHIVPVIGEYTQQNSIVRKDRIDRIIKEARQQSGSPVNTVCEDSCTLASAMEFWHGLTFEHTDSVAFALYERTEKTQSIGSVLQNCKTVNKAAIAVGSEGGISPNEIEILQKNGFVPIHFETNILRCETAALYGLAALQSALIGMN